MHHTRLFLIRHGETHANIEQRYQGQGESNLSELGIEEAQALSKFLSNEKFAAIYSSTLVRSNTTAKIIAAPHKIEVVKVPKLLERHYGEWENLTFEEIRDKYPKIYENWLENPGKTKIPGAESLTTLQKRGVQAIDSLKRKHRGNTFCVVGHGGINRTILFHYMNIGLNNFWRIKQDNCCINIIEFNKHIPMVTLLNSTAFLGEKRISGGYY